MIADCASWIWSRNDGLRLLEISFLIFRRVFLGFSSDTLLTDLGAIMKQALLTSSAKDKRRLFLVSSPSRKLLYCWILWRRSDAFRSYSLFLAWELKMSFAINKLSISEPRLCDVCSLMICLRSALRQSLFRSSATTSCTGRPPR